MPPRKSAAAAAASPPATPAGGRRRSQRIGSSGKKSVYFDDDDNESDFDELGEDRPVKRLKKRNVRGSDEDAENDENDDVYGEDEENEYDESTGDDDDDDNDEEDEFEDDESDHDTKGRKTQARLGKTGVTKAKKVANGKHGDDGGFEESDDDDDEDAAPKVTFTPHKKLRELGGVEYDDDRLHKNTMLFLRDLRANNNRLWLQENDREYRRSLDDWKSFVETFTQKLIDADETVPELPPKDIIFRIYRDVRFSKDPTPYKAHYSAAWSRTGKKGPYACYYVHCEPGGKSFVGGGLWSPDKEHIEKLRASIDERPRRWRRALMDPELCRVFFPKAKSRDDESVITAFAEGNARNALKTKPKGFHAEHRDLALLKLRNYTVSKKLPDSIFTDDDGQEQLAEIVRVMVPYITFLNRIVMPDPSESDSESEEEEE